MALLSRRVTLPMFVKVKRCVAKDEVRVPDSLSFTFALRATRIPNVQYFEENVKLEELADLEMAANISINIFGVAPNGVEIVCVSEHYSAPPDRHVNLLYVRKRNRERYFLITNVSRLLGEQVAPRRRKSVHICRACLRHFLEKEDLTEHWTKCGPNSPYVPIPVIPLDANAEGRKLPRRKRAPSRRLALEANKAGLCVICCVRLRSALYIPCSHVAACYVCATKAGKITPACIVCKTPFVRIEKVFLS